MNLTAGRRHGTPHSPCRPLTVYLEHNLEISINDRASLALLCGLKDGEEVPEAVLVQYKRARRMMSRVGAGGPLPPAALVMVGLCAGLGYELQSDVVPPSFEDYVRDGTVKTGDTIMVTWRGKEMEATFQKITTGRRVSFRLPDKKDTLAVALDHAKPLPSVLEA